ncbi:hypothetical protein AVEN_53883-1 [Araneus ventricosus]|uniref:Uncharacterized protein n=1 Tax=Araneus ventricosus TaxID=182803 RepID=A0A4Y2Q508_ARAVE|nr:hypothetical protein AVEN_53883-1 [Araneus ventricosus]
MSLSLRTYADHYPERLKIAFLINVKPAYNSAVYNHKPAYNDIFHGPVGMDLMHVTSHPPTRDLPAASIGQS